MNLLEARRILDAFAGGPPLRFLLGMSGTGEPLVPYLRAAAARHGHDAQVRLLPFNTLQQALLGVAAADVEREVFMLCPWDLVPELDWRSGAPVARLDAAAALASADSVLERLRRRSDARLAYLPAPVPAACADASEQAELEWALRARASGAGALTLESADFSLGSYFGSGLPVAGRALGRVAASLVELVLEPRREPAKLLVTDLDNTLWRGVIAEEGPGGIAWRAEGAGYRHFVYQTFLRRLKGEGVLLAAVSRNSPEVALEPLRAGGMPLREEDFVAVVASYHAKSAQLRELVRQLNLGLDAVVYVDDNPVELEEVSRELPAVRCLAFPAQDEGLPALLAELHGRFGRRTVTEEDRGRTELYRRRIEGLVPQAVAGADLEDFLRGLEMRLTVHDRSAGDRTRAVQLINKTNQFNLNGRRVTDDEVAAVLAAGGRLLTATLEDRTGSHGEILAMLIGADGVVQSFVLSCRVFQRRVEHAFCAWLARQPAPPAAMAFAPTERNEPFRMFLADPAFGPAQAGIVTWDAGAFSRAYAGDLALFRLEAPVQA